jgi:hypothetical protein
MEFSGPAKSGQAKPSIKCKFWKRCPKKSSASDGGFSDIGVDRITHVAASAGDCGPIWPRPSGRDPLAPRAVQPPPAFLRFEFCSFRFSRTPHVSRGMRADGRVLELQGQPTRVDKEFCMLSRRRPARRLPPRYPSTCAVSILICTLIA